MFLDEKTRQRVLGGSCATVCACDFCTGKKKREDNWCPYCGEVQLELPKYWENLDVCNVCEEKLKEYNKHLEHGYGVPGMGPYHSDCECRETSERENCAISGCGFCIADIQREKVKTS